MNLELCIWHHITFPGFGEYRPGKVNFEKFNGKVSFTVLQSPPAFSSSFLLRYKALGNDNGIFL
ncbi:MAG: hypothetical protein A2V65_09895 [Deltaproteobacteria bacterium RBG_13_49_15]|nr:MAG: hypothetical protein A2V65_09895 [Deltaproteobacteria bacterium RBG_13_49_15]